MLLSRLTFSSLFFNFISVHADTSTSLKCVTRMGRTSVAILPTITKTIIRGKREIVRVTSTPTVTVTVTRRLTPITITTTVLDTTTRTLRTITGVFSTTSTIILSTTATETLVSTATELARSTTSTVVTSAIPTSTGFLPVADTKAEAYPLVKKREIHHPHDSNAAASKERAKKEKGDKKGKRPGWKNQFPASVVWLTYPTATPDGLVKTKTKTITLTSTIAPGASITSSFSTTITERFTTTKSKTETTTSTQTETSTSTVTSYDACATSNLLSTLSNGNFIAGFYNQGLGNPSTFTMQSEVSAYACCVACTTNSICTGSVFVSSPGTCMLLQNSGNTCGEQSSASGFYVSQPLVDLPLTVSNGNCGYLWDGGLGL
ncbi:hypothetical protein P154DRAFT_539356 [Amniculicola lignicola CBS 123094]|uniref:Apple domain-containing protein n=1 Tax=Amniculicola lignicola CBS 123094 TaxID=1392246 RepID=A0A6A5W3J2_9PLEO|nr:hypothetical protein P154DRAFT_539356 [Amniculicola lignicola CBS 123094]